MKILHIVQSLKGGPASYLSEILPDQIERWGASSVGVVAPLSDRDHLPPEVLGATFFWFPDARRSPSSLAAFGWTIATSVRAFRPDVVHLHSTFAGAAGRGLLLPLPRRPKIVYCAHGWAFERQSARPSVRRLTASLERALARSTDAIVNISHAEAAAADAHRIRARRNVVFPNAIEDRPWGGSSARIAAAAAAGFDPAKINLLFVGRHDPQKGADIAEAAAATLPRDRFHLYNIGESVVDRDGALSASPVANVTRLGWKPREEVSRTMAAADALIVPSRWEGFGLVAVEAMRAGTAVIASAAGALPEIVENGVTGLVVAEGSAPAFAAAIARLDRETLHAMGVAGRRRFEKLYRRERLLSDLHALYGDLAGERGLG